MSWYELDADLTIKGRFWVEADTAAEAQTALENMNLFELKQATDDSRFSRSVQSITVTAVSTQDLHAGAPGARR